ncbi:redoxin domain-containing protein [Halomarina ordinaria]|uniref:Redoxin domain-containing protein n=1 Tax=Halomarina ordinaria TaxID=3033939 RepID=A0ABD5UB02_9EURY|nr:redoxin domain-containing protein [Halomarina sp. PSRA2]
MPPTVGERAPDFESLLCTGETFRSTRLDEALDGGCVLVFSAFSFSAIAENWWKRYERAGWADFDVPVLGVTRDGPYAQNAFLRYLESPFRLFSDVDGRVGEAYDLLVEREGMANTTTSWRAVFVLDADRTVTYAWVADDWISPVPREEVEEAVAQL